MWRTTITLTTTLGLFFVCLFFLFGCLIFFGRSSSIGQPGQCPHFAARQLARPGIRLAAPGNSTVFFLQKNKQKRNESTDVRRRHHLHAEASPVYLVVNRVLLLLLLSLLLFFRGARRDADRPRRNGPSPNRRRRRAAATRRATCPTSPVLVPRLHHRPR